MSNEKRNAYMREWNAKHKDSVHATQKKYREKNKDAIAARTKLWAAKNRPPTRITHNPNLYDITTKSGAELMQKNHDLRQRIYSDLWKITRGQLKSGWLFRLLDCTIDELSAYIEAQFMEGMTFDNLGEWEVRFARGLIDFDLTQPDHLVQACHHTNLVPRWKPQAKPGFDGL